ncbi:unnamed protein product [Cyprideis torosa]|uniref:Uncharacterized protein n=1 Tax=Cyprideis torosa TaxID=163714 RepID=A0A7R8WFM4_9CRUS|nr:unnamed protein product [Cyprideis torosa]CAG0890762.1 unnamed protein product [Cyprideis torosa]
MTSKSVLCLEAPHGPGGVFFSWQKGQGNYIVTTGLNQYLYIFERNASVAKYKILLQGVCTAFGWSCDGDMLAAINNRTPQLLLWDARTGRQSTVDTGLKESLSYLVWSKSSPLLAVGTVKGNLVIYNHKTTRRIPIMGKHSKSITCGSWSTENVLALGSEDKSLSISNSDGDTLRTVNLSGQPGCIQFSEMKQTERTPGGGENTVSLVIGKKTLFLFNINDPENPVELAFQSRYGNIVTYEWFGDGYILIGFSAGFFVVISTFLKEIGQELYQTRNHKDSLRDIAVCPALGKAASCGDNVVKIHEISDMKEVSEVINVDGERVIESISWTDDGQLLALSTNKGNLHIYLSKLPLLADAHAGRVLFLTSLRELSIAPLSQPEQVMTVTLDMEPTFVACGTYHVTAGMNNRAWFYGMTDGGSPVEFVRDREYLGTVHSMRLNETYASALCGDGSLLLHVIEGEGGEAGEERESRLFPPSDKSASVRITDHAITPEFLIYASAGGSNPAHRGSIVFFYLEEWKEVLEFKHSKGVRAIYTEPHGGLNLVFIDDSSQGQLLDPVTEETTPIPSFPQACQGVLWDEASSDDGGAKGCFVAFDKDKAWTYIYVKESTDGAHVSLVGETKLPLSQAPIALFAGELLCQTQGGKISQFLLSSHEMVGSGSEEQMRQAVIKCLKLHRFRDAFDICVRLESEEYWNMLGRAAMKDLDLDIAVRVYREIGDVGMVWSLQSLVGIEDVHLLAGHFSMFCGDYDQAQEHYLKSSTPSAALEMRRDLLQWDNALQLASNLSPEQIPVIAKEYAQQLEFTGDYGSALSHFERGLTIDAEKVNMSAGNLEEHTIACKAGVARCSIRCGDVRKGVQLAADLQSKALKRECAEILENIKQYGEAANLYDKGGYYDKAALLYIRLKNWTKVSDLLPQINNPKIHLQYAKAKEMEGQYKEAVAAYVTARDFDSAVRVHLEHLNNLEEAVRIVKETRSNEGAKMVARFFQRMNDFGSAIQFLAISHCNEEAFRLAQQHGKMALYAEIIGEDATPQDYTSIAVHFENEKNAFLAGKFRYLAGDHEQAMRHLIRAAQNNSENADVLNLAVQVAAASGDDYLQRNLIDFLLGDIDGVPKDPRFLFRLYMAKRQFSPAAKTAVLIALNEQNSDLVPILTSTVIECQRSGLKDSAFKWATVLLRPEHREHIDPKYKKKIESIVRKPTRAEEEEPKSPCPFCGFSLRETALDCTQCKNHIPFCIVTGRHVVKGDLTSCPQCNFPGLRTEFIKFASSNEPCPMCGEEVSEEDLKIVSDITPFLRMANLSPQPA